MGWCPVTSAQPWQTSVWKTATPPRGTPGGPGFQTNGGTVFYFGALQLYDHQPLTRSGARTPRPVPLRAQGWYAIPTGYQVVYAVDNCTTSVQRLEV